MINEKYEQIIENIVSNQYAVIDDFFTSEEVEVLKNGLIELQQKSAFKKSAIGNNQDEKVIDAIRGDYIFWLDEDNSVRANQLFFEKIKDFAQYINQTCYLGIQKYEFHYAIYPIGTYYKKHLDVFQNDKRRRLSMVCYLNDENWLPEYGGALAIYKNDEIIRVFPEKGRMVIFDSQILEHEVEPVVKERYSITGWLKTS